MLMKSMLNVFEMNGKVREARTLHSITLRSLLLAKYWILKGPEMLRALAIFLVVILTLRMVSTRFWAGRTSVASPEWTPAFSTCSEMATRISPLRATASISISLASSINLEMTTGRGDTSAGLSQKSVKIFLVYATFMAAPLSTEGRTRMGNPTRSPKASASSV
eukprot:15112_3